MNNHDQPEKYCYLNPKYPSKAYLGFMTIMKQKNISLIYPFMHLFSTLKHFQQDALVFIKSMEKKNIQVNHHAMIYPITLTEIFPLKKSYWDNSTIKYSNEKRIHLLVKSAQFYAFYKLVVTPINLESKKPIYLPAFPITLQTPDTIIEQFMIHSDFPVDKVAKFAGIYRFNKPFGINALTGEINKTKKFHVSKNSN
ncbi:hypothetical protein ACFL1P_01040 [Patescibacteria group bacterium]